jgi:hypothetical protein
VTAVADKLREARALIERGWVQVLVAGDAKGRSAPLHSDTAVVFCPYGALQRVTVADNGLYGRLLELVKRAVGLGKGSSLIVWNDAPERTQAEVLAAFDKAIELAESAQ